MTSTDDLAELITNFYSPPPSHPADLAEIAQLADHVVRSDWFKAEIATEYKMGYDQGFEDGYESGSAPALGRSS
jgi:hypothetical protein